MEQKLFRITLNYEMIFYFIFRNWKFCYWPDVYSPGFDATKLFIPHEATKLGYFLDVCDLKMYSDHGH